MASQKYQYSVGRRKTAVARVRFYEGTPESGEEYIVNEKKLADYFSEREQAIVKSPVELLAQDLGGYFTFKVVGGGKNAQAEAIRHGIARLLVAMNEEWKPALKAKGYTTRDSRMKERKKPGLRRARRAPQWSKR
jgi:small subunit ribosomal protein S9